MAYRLSPHSEVSMNEADRNLFTTWRNIAALASTETDPDKLAQVVEELRAALNLHEAIRQDAAKKSA